MSIVPYNQQVVLRHNDAVVLYDPQSKQFDVTSHRGLGDCPLCHRPLQREDRPQSPENETPGLPKARGFVSPEYFRMLQDSLPGSANSSSPPSPRRRLVEPVRSIQGSTRSPRSSDHISDPPAAPAPHTGISASAFSPGYFKRFFVVEKELGRGGKGVVLLVTHVLDNVDLGQYACKRVPVGNDHVWLTNVLNEVRLLEHLSHQHLVYYKHVWLEDIKISTFGPSVPCAFILQQYCNAGDLHQYIVGPARTSEDSTQALKERVRRHSRNQMEPSQELPGRKLRFDEIYSLFKDITSGLNHLHVNGFIHRDLKPSNCLLHDSGKGLRALVSDFGEVQIENVARKSTGATGTVSYCAPEVLRRSPTTGALGNFTTKSDIFSLGMILYFLCFARLPYRNADHLNEDNEDLDLLRAEIVSWTGLHEERKLRPDLPEQLYTFLRRLLSLDPTDRPSAEDILLGIKTGSGLDPISDSRPKSAAHMFDDLGSSSRISPVDSPRPTPPNRKLSTPFVRANAPSKVHIPSLHRDRNTGPTPRPEDSHQNPYSPSPSPYEDDDDDESDTGSPTSPSDSLVLRPRFPPPIKLPSSPPILIPGAPTTRWPAFHNPSTHRSIKIMIFLSKVISLNILCAPVAVNPVIAYPLLGLAALDVLLDGMSGVGISLALVLVHAAVLVWGMGGGWVCMGPVGLWGRF